MCCALFNGMKFLCSLLNCLRKTYCLQEDGVGEWSGARGAAVFGFLGGPALIEPHFSAVPFFLTARLSAHEHGLRCSDKFHVAAR